VPAVTVAAGKGFRWLNWLGHILVKTVEVEIGGQRIDKHYSDWLHIWNELTQTAGHQLGYANMVGNTPNLTTPMLNKTGSGVTGTVGAETLYIPLQFWFNRNPGERTMLGIVKAIPLLVE
jgi:ABC-type phosphate/phosphonate transport system permease subunit